MHQNFSQSTPSHYYTPKKRSQTSEKVFSDKIERSTASRFYDLEESFKQYEHLLEQNLHLKTLLLNQNPVQINHQQEDLRSKLFKQTQNFEDQFDKKYRKNSSTNCLSTNAFNQSFSMQSANEVPFQPNVLKGDDIALWSVKKRNMFLQQKLDNLQNQYAKQTKKIQKIVHSQKWKNRFDCKQLSCYQDKYMKILRVKSPVFLQ